MQREALRAENRPSWWSARTAITRPSSSILRKKRQLWELRRGLYERRLLPVYLHGTGKESLQQPTLLETPPNSIRIELTLYVATSSESVNARETNTNGLLGGIRTGLDTRVRRPFRSSWLGGALLRRGSLCAPSATYIRAVRSLHFSISLLPTLPSHQRHPYGRICLCVECMSLCMHILLTYMYCVVVDRCGGP